MHIGELNNDESGLMIDNYNNDDASGVSSLITSQSKKKNKKNNLPTYSWESSTEENNPKNTSSLIGQERIFTAEYGSFVPSSTPGVYMAEEEVGGSDDGASEMSDHLGDKSMSGYPSTHLDIQVLIE
jgi:hypothetical protein